MVSSETLSTSAVSLLAVLVERQVLRKLQNRRIAAPLLRVLHTCPIHQNTAHSAGRNGEEMSPSLKIHRSVVRQPQVCLIHQGSRLQCVPRAFLSHVVPRKQVQFPIRQWY